MPHAFDRRLAAGPLLCDGAMGTLLYARGVSIDACFDVLNVSQAKALLEGGIDAFVVETFSDLTEIALAIETIRTLTDLPIVAQMAFTDEGVTFAGRSPAEVARTLRELGVRALGANCSVGSSTL